jgi:opacity protein-like surface antigen
VSRARLAAALAAVAVVAVPLAPAAHAVDVVKCVNDNNRIGFPYGGYDVNPQGTVTCLHG